jgi:S-DNA-T family DNA segregation ATPase FtsK/SpoIIIE
MDTVGLTKERHGTDYVPPLLSVRSNRWMDKLTIRMLPGQRVQDFVDTADRIHPTFGAHDCRVRITKNPHKVQLWLLVRDPLSALVDPFPPALHLADGLPVARCEDGASWLLRLLGTMS